MASVACRHDGGLFAHVWFLHTQANNSEVNATVKVRQEAVLHLKGLHQGSGTAGFWMPPFQPGEYPQTEQC